MVAGGERPPVAERAGDADHRRAGQGARACTTPGGPACRSPRSPNQVPSLGTADGYAVQREPDRGSCSRTGTTIVGHKVGLTSKAMQRMVGVDSSYHGPVLASMILLATATSDLTWTASIGAEIEAEIGVVGGSASGCAWAGRRHSAGGLGPRSPASVGGDGDRRLAHRGTGGSSSPTPSPTSRRTGAMADCRRQLVPLGVLATAAGRDDADPQRRADRLRGSGCGAGRPGRRRRVAGERASASAALGAGAGPPGSSTWRCTRPSR